jgi:hypothetical protein
MRKIPGVVKAPVRFADLCTCPFAGDRNNRCEFIILQT